MTKLKNILNNCKLQPEGRRLERSTLAWENSSSTVGVTITLDREVKYQQIIGYVGQKITMIIKYSVYQIADVRYCFKKGKC